MSALQSEVYEAFRDLGADEDKALRAASAIGNAIGKVADQHVGDMNGIRADVAAIRVELTATKGKVDLLQYMVALCITLLVTILFKLFTH